MAGDGPFTGGDGDKSVTGRPFLCSDGKKRSTEHLKGSSMDLFASLMELKESTEHPGESAMHSKGASLKHQWGK
jgi:hypothetical protein